MPPAAASADTAVAALIGVAPPDGLPALPVLAASPVLSISGATSRPHASPRHPLIRLLRPVLELDAEPLVERNDGDVVAELACPVRWNG